MKKNMTAVVVCSVFSLFAPAFAQESAADGDSIGGDHAVSRPVIGAAAIPPGPARSAQVSTDTGVSPLSGARQEDFAGEKMYEALISSKRRDIPVQSNAPDTLQAKRPQAVRLQAEPQRSIAATPAVAPKTATLPDSISITVGASAGTSGHQAGITKRSVFLAAAVCVLLGGGVAVYMIKNAKADETIGRNSIIPQPPDPPMNFDPSP